jgi:hypothetical protein
MPNKSYTYTLLKNGREIMNGNRAELLVFASDYSRPDFTMRLTVDGDTDVYTIKEKAEPDPITMHLGQFGPQVDSTGGGCEALAIYLDGVTLVVTDTDGVNVPSVEEDEIMLGVYDNGPLSGRTDELWGNEMFTTYFKRVGDHLPVDQLRQIIEVFVKAYGYPEMKGPEDTPLWVKTFGREYDIPQEILDKVASEEWQDESYRNDVCPSFGNQTRSGHQTRIFVEHPDPKKRENKDAKRFCVLLIDGDGTCVNSFDTDNLDRALAVQNAYYWEVGP